MKNLDISALEQTIEKYPWFSLAYLELYKKVCELGEEQKYAYLSRSAAYLYSREKLYYVSSESHNYVTTEKEDFKERESEDTKLTVEAKEATEAEETTAVETAEAVEITEAEAAAVEAIEIEKTTAEAEENREDDVSEEMSFEIEVDPLHLYVPVKMLRVGGDYFNRADLEELQLDATKPLDKFISEKPTLLRSNPLIAQKESCQIEEVKIEEYFEDSYFYTETLAKIYSEQGFTKRALEVYAKLILLYPEKSSYFASLVQEIKSKHN